MTGRSEGLTHELVPLHLAVSVVQSKLSSPARKLAGPADGVAMFMGATVPIYEYFEPPSRLPKILTRVAQEGIFRCGGRELHFLDGRPTKQLLAISAGDVERVLEMLEHPDRALHVRSRVLRAASGKLKQHSGMLKANSERLLAHSRLILTGYPNN